MDGGGSGSATQSGSTAAVLVPAATERGGGQGGADAAPEAGQAVADAEDDDGAVVAAAEVVDGCGSSTGRRLDVDDLAAGEPRVPAGRLEGDPQGTEDQSGLDDGVSTAQQPADELAPDGRVGRPDAGGVEELELPEGGIWQVGRLSHECQLRLVMRDGERAVGPESDGWGVHGQLLPQVTGPHGQVELGALGATTDPDQSEVADRGAPGAGVGLEMGDLPAASAGL